MRTRTTTLSILATIFAAGCAGGAKMPAATPASHGPAAYAESGAAPAEYAEREAPRAESAAPAAAPSKSDDAAPPPPAAPMVAAGGADASGAMPSGGAGALARAEAPAKRSVAAMDRAAEPAGMHRPLVMPEPSGVRAGEWDDNANYREFQRWLATESRQPFHPIDVRDRQFLVVRDADGRGVPRCAIAISDSSGHRTTLTTTAAGRAILFPHAEGLSGPLVATASCREGSAQVAFSGAADDGVVELPLQAKRAPLGRPIVDIGFVLDTTGSMSEEIAAVKATIQKVASSLAGRGVEVRIGMVEYKDRGDEFVTRVHPMTTDLASFAREVSSVRASGGGDTPESVNEGLHVGLRRLAWDGEAVAKLAFLVGDAPPHLDYQQDFDYAADARQAAHRGIKVFTIAASGMDDLGQVVFRQIAQYTGATNMFVLRGGAGPQSTGAGDPKSSCGGTQTAYASGNLDVLVVKKVERELRDLDADPLRIAGLHGDENAKPCAERLVMAE